MNRTTALFLAVALLFAHALAIHHTSDGNFAPSYDDAHVAFRLGRNLVREGTLAWNPGGPAFESYPSPLWVALCAVAERLYWSPNAAAQWTGVACTLATVAVVAGFSLRRLVGVIAPAMLVVNGALAACATDGSETALFTLFVTAAYLAYERRNAKWMAGLLSLAVLTRPEGALFTLALLGIELVRRTRGKPDGRHVLRSFALPVVVIALLAFARIQLFGTPLSPLTASLLRADGGGLAVGASYLFRHLFLFGSPLLFAVALYALPRGALGGTGVRAVVLTLFWIALVLLSGGEAYPFGRSIVPALPFLFLATQEALTLAVDSKRPTVSWLAWVLVLLGLGASVLASKSPGDVGALRIGSYLEARSKPGPVLEGAWGKSLGRVGLQHELAHTARVRRFSIFLRDRLDPERSILTPWPGAIGYLTHKTVFDLGGRATPPTEGAQLRSWYGRPRVDVVEVLRARRPDYVVATISGDQRAPTPLEIAIDGLLPYDLESTRAGREREILGALSAYELISVPVPSTESTFARSNTPGYLLRHRELGLGPTLAIEVEGDRFRVLARQTGHQQLADLVVSAVDADGRLWSMRPTGDFAEGARVHARTGLLLYPSGGPMTQLLAGRLPESLGAVSLSAVLKNPGSQGTGSGHSAVSDEVVRQL